MPDSEKQLAIIEDVLLPSDRKNRYDIYITDSRIAIVCLGKIDRYESESFSSLSAVPQAFGVPAPIQENTHPKPNMAAIKEELNRMPLDDLLKLSKKSSFYNYDEIEELRLILSKHPSFKIMTEEYESKFAPDAEQAMELLDWLTAVEPLKSKLAVAGKWSVLEEIFQSKSKK
jgi:hypothetical protein